MTNLLPRLQELATVAKSIMMANQVLVLMEKEIDNELKFKKKFKNLCLEMADTVKNKAKYIEELERYPWLQANVEAVETAHPIPAAPVPAHAGQQVAPEALAAHAAWEEGQSVSSYILKIKSYFENLKRLRHPVTHGLRVSLILILLRKEFNGFMLNYNMHNMGKTINELHAMLKLHEQTLSKNNAHSLHAIRAGKVQKGNKKHKKPQPQLAARGQNQRKGKNKLAYAPKPKIPPPPRGKILLRTQSGASGPGIFTIKLYIFPNKSWVYDTGYGTHICNTSQGLRRSRKLKPGALSLYVGNGQRTAIQAIGSYHLSLPSGLVIVLNNCHYVPSITRGIISVSCLYDDGYVNHFVDNSIKVSRNNMAYFSAILRDGIFKIDLCDSYTYVSSMYALSNKKPKSNLDSALFWHCRLGHISKKRIEKLQHDGLLNSTDLRAFEKCIVSRQGASYFVTFTDDFSRYGYVCSLKHKHEVFETFKVFQKEVENQIGKTIKSLRSDHEGEYMSQEFLDHLKDHGIIVHRTPYTPQQNGVSERRNRTLLDMVRSMMSQKTLPKFFWDYALEIAEHILNMVPTKKVEKIPYENKVLVARNAEFLENSLITQEASGSLEDLEIIQEEDTYSSIDTILNHEEDDLEIYDIIPIHRSTRTRHTPDCMCLYIDAEDELGDLGEPFNYKATLLDPKSDK
nr:hypothetical protein [Tanacetum cinerariifolium]